MNGQEIIILIQGEPIQKRGAQVEIVDGLFKTFAHLYFVNKNIVRFFRLICLFNIRIQLVILQQRFVFAQAVIDVYNVSSRIRLPDILHTCFQQF